METHTIERDGDTDLRFKGELLASASSSPDTARSDYSGSTGRWTVLELYRTAAGNYVVHEVGRTSWDGEQDRHTATVCEAEAEVVDAVRTHDGRLGRLGKQVLEEAGIDAVEEIA
jgi:hypothetical protein